MNYCNFAKVIIARNSKDPQSIDLWNSSSGKNNNSSPQLAVHLGKFNNLYTASERYEFYSRVMFKYPKMHVPYTTFVRQLPRLQNYLTKNSYWKNANKNGEKSQFLNHFDLKKWCTLSEKDKKTHQLANCVSCESQSLKETALHKSVSVQASSIISKTQELFTEVKNLKGTKPEHIIRILEPVMEKEFKTSMKSTVSKQFILIEKPTSEQKQKQNIKQTKENKQKMHRVISENSNDLHNFLASGKSFSQLQRERLETYYETPRGAKERTEKQTNKIKEGKTKLKNHVGKAQNYQLKKDEFIEFLQNVKPGSAIVWRSLALKFNLRNRNGNIPQNSGQIMKVLAEINGIDTSKLNTQIRVSGRDYFQRVRRAKMRFCPKVSIPTPRPVRKLQNEVKEKIQTNELYIGEKIVPKIFNTNKISPSGELEDKHITVYGRKIPLELIRNNMIQEQSELIKIRTDDEYNKMTEDEIKVAFASKFNINVPGTKEDLKRLERTRHLKLWHDHSDILNHTYISFMVSTMYNPNLYLTNQEYCQKFPDRPPIDVQATVEKPHLYILGQSKSTDADQLSYTLSRIEDLKQLVEPVEIGGVPIFDVMRVFSGDGPARQFEAGQQRGGNFSCLCGIPSKEHSNLEYALGFHPPSLLDRCEVFKGGCLWRRFSLTNPSPFSFSNHTSWNSASSSTLLFRGRYP